jgi:hypothetical protein
VRLTALVSVMTVAGLLAGCGGSQERTLNVSVMGTFSPEKVKFQGQYKYIKGGKELTEDISGEGNRSEAFRGDKITQAEVRKTGGKGWIQLVIGEDGKQVYRSERTENDQALTYQAP